MRLWPRRGRRVDVTKQRVVKFLPSDPPERGDWVTVDGERCVVTYCKITWEGLEWTLHELRVKPR